MKILFLPFLKIPTGHHTVADALINSLKKRTYNSIECKKIDFLSYSDKLLEKAFRITYLKWIDHSPETFEWLYRNFVYPSKSTKHFYWYEKKFLSKMETLINEEQPDLIVCTQAFPSFLLSRLRYYGINTPPIINIYTDFFINNLWGIREIDYHFVPDFHIKKQLEHKYNINPSHIFITGIPIDDCFISDCKPKQVPPIPPYHILISGGNSGLGEIQNLISNLPKNKNYFFSVLCGRNKKLYKEIMSLNQENIKPLSYISSRETMNTFYNEADAIITKPGGVTLSEALWKRLPIFIHSSLPGQEDINKQYLLNHKLINILNINTSISYQLDSFFSNIEEQIKWQQKVNEYINQFECLGWQKIIELAIKTSLEIKNYNEVRTFFESNNFRR